MDAIIANMAKQAHFDAAHYTWVYVDNERLAGMDDERVEQELVKHGDYATPLRTDHIKLPFNNIAMVYAISPSQYAILTLDCENSCVKHIVSWMQQAIAGDARGCTIEFKPSNLAWDLYEQNKEKLDLINGQEDGGRFEASPEKEKNALVSLHPALPDKLKRGLLGFTTAIGRRAVRYIAASSGGLFIDETPVFYRPKSIGNNAKRKRKGKAPLYEWSTVQLERKIPELPAAPKGGTHASPRLHQRRGHWVTSKLGKRFWRSESVVGKPENGMIFHDYKDGGSHA